jgi:hypothetical protein
VDYSNTVGCDQDTHSVSAVTGVRELPDVGKCESNIVILTHCADADGEADTLITNGALFAHVGNRIKEAFLERFEAISCSRNRMREGKLGWY